MPDRLYLDHNATSPMRPEVREAMMEVLEGAHNPSSTHAEGRAAKKRLEDARGIISDTLGAPREGIIFTSGGTEADNMALRGLVHGSVGVRHIFVSAIEHDAVTAEARQLAETRNVRTEVIPVTGDGVVDLSWLERRMASYDLGKDGPFVVAVMLANNETGVIQPVAELGRMVWPSGGYVFVDAVQAFGKIEVDFTSLGADLMAIGAHKIGGPVGVGALLTKPGLPLAPTQRGGGQELSRRAGTENLAAIAGFARCAEVSKPTDHAALVTIRDRIEAGLPKGVTVWGRAARRLPSTSCFTAPGFASETQVMTMDLAGMSVSAGSACSSGKVRKSSVLGAMGAGTADTSCSLRVSLGWNTPPDAAERFLGTWNREYERIAGRPAA